MALLHSPKIPTDGLVLCLDPANAKSYSGSGNVCYDLSKNNNHAQLINSPIYSKENGGIFKCGINGISHLEIADADSLDLTSKMSMGIWIRFYQENTGFYKTIFGKPTYAVYGIVVEWYGGNGILADTLINGNRNALYYVSPNSVPTLNSWIFVMQTYENNEQPNNRNLYYFDKNGLNYNWNWQEEINYITNTSEGDINISEEPIMIGDNTNEFPIDVGPVFLYNKELSKKEVLDIFNSTRGRFGI
jgi:hypothetical protein